MSAEGNLYNPAIFTPASEASKFTPEDPTAPSNWVIASDTGLHLPHTMLALEYLAIVNSLETWTSPSAVKGHLFKLLRPAMSKETDLREQLGRVRFQKGKEKEAYAKYEEIVKQMDERMRVRRSLLCKSCGTDRSAPWMYSAMPRLQKAVLSESSSP